MFPSSRIELVPIARRTFRGAPLMMLAVAAATVALAIASFPPAGGTACESLSGATRSPHVQVAALPGVDLGPVLDLPGLAAASGPYPGAATSLRWGGREGGVWLEGRRGRRSAVDTPLLSSGSWLRPGSLVVERRLASKLRIERGDRVPVAGANGNVRLRVAGIAVTSASRRTRAVSGLAYLLPGDLRRVVPNTRVRGSTVLVRLADHRRSGALAQWLGRRYPGPQVTVAQAFPDRCLVRAG